MMSDKDVSHKVEVVKQQINQTFLQLEHLGKESLSLIEDIYAVLDEKLSGVYLDNAKKQEVANKFTVVFGNPSPDQEILKKAIEVLHGKLDNLYSLDDSLKLLNKEVSKVEVIQTELGLDKPRSQDKDKYARVAASMDTLLEDVKNMSMTISGALRAEKDSQFTHDKILGKNFDTLDQKVLNKGVSVLKNNVSAWYAVVDELKQGKQVDAKIDALMQAQKEGKPLTANELASATPDAETPRNEGNSSFGMGK